MEITFVTESHQIRDDKQTVNVVTHDEVDNCIAENVIVQEQQRRLGAQEDELREHRKWTGEQISWLWNGEESINTHKVKIEALEGRIDKLPCALKETLGQILEEMFADKLDCFAKQVENLKIESIDIEGEMKELRKERNESKDLLEELRNQCNDAKRTLAESESLLEVLRKSLFIPKKLFRFMFTRPSENQEKEK